jgi:hypothetical protein
MRIDFALLLEGQRLRTNRRNAERLDDRDYLAAAMPAVEEVASRRGR